MISFLHLWKRIKILEVLNSVVLRKIIPRNYLLKMALILVNFFFQMKRKREKRLEFIWRGSKSLGKSTDIFTGILYNGINPPQGFCFDLQCIFEDQPTSVVNISQVVDEFIKEVYRQKDSHQTNHVLQIMGNDFTLQYADSVYEKLDELIELVNKVLSFVLFFGFVIFLYSSNKHFS